MKSLAIDVESRGKQCVGQWLYNPCWFQDPSNVAATKKSSDKTSRSKHMAQCPYFSEQSLHICFGISSEQEPSPDSPRCPN